MRLVYYLYNVTVEFLQALAALFHTDYNTVNIWFYCIVGPVVFMTLIAVLWGQTAWGLTAHHHKMNMASNLLMASVLVLTGLVLMWVAWHLLPVFTSLASGDMDQQFDNCVNYLTSTYGERRSTYAIVNVFFFCFLGPIFFLTLLFLIVTGFHKFSWHWLAAFHRPSAWRYWLNAMLLLLCAPSCAYALHVLKRYIVA